MESILSLLAVVVSCLTLVVVVLGLTPGVVVNRGNLVAVVLYGAVFKIKMNKNYQNSCAIVSSGNDNL